MNNKDIHLDLLRILESNPECTQRDLSREIGVSLGKVNYCIKKLNNKGWIKLISFSHSRNKLGYAYLLTPKGIEEKAKLTFKFLRLKMAEYEMLKNEISELERDINKINFK
tara:strand:+ start:7150 stop:7482 length:333 start_codon:yes stop_codon:yes gene_type:complete